MLGRIFENLLAEINPETGDSAKKSTGSFYTPRDIVDYMVDSSIFEYLKDKTKIDDNLLRAVVAYNKDHSKLVQMTQDDKKQLVSALYDMTTLDPACGSGAFPIGLLQKIVFIYKEIDPDAKLWFDKATKGITNNFIKKEFEKKFSKSSLEYTLKLSVIQNSIFGIDIQPIAVEISRLRCFLSLIIEETVDDNIPNRGIEPLPNLDFKFVIANSLIPLDNQEQTAMFEDNSHIEQLKSIREEYFNATPERRLELKYNFTNVQKTMFENTLKNFSKQASKRYAQLSSWNPFENQSTDWFDSEWMFGIKGFDIVIANPPYIHLEKLKDSDKTLFFENGNKKKSLYKTYEARGDLYCLFYEMGIKNTKDGGYLTFITSNKWMRAGYGQSLRNFFVDYSPKILIDLGSGIFSSATVDTNILILQNSANKYELQALTYTEKNLQDIHDFVNKNATKTKFKKNQIWTILLPIEQSIKSKIEAVGTPLREWDVQINYGIKTGCNEAFIIDSSKRQEILNNCKDDFERTRTEQIIRPILRGRDIQKNSYTWAGLYLINTHDGYIDKDGNAISRIDLKNYPTIKEHLKTFQDKISVRTDKGATPYNLRSCAYMDHFNRQKIVYSETNNLLQTKIALDKDNYYTDKTCFILIGKTDILTLHCYDIMSSNIFTWFMSLQSPNLGESGISLTKESIENFPLCPINCNYQLTQEEINFISSSLNS